jgi:hypothetical protein
VAPVVGRSVLLSTLALVAALLVVTRPRLPGGAAIAAAGAGWIRDLQGTYDLAFYLAAGLCFGAALLCAGVRRPAVPAS